MPSITAQPAVVAARYAELTFDRMPSAVPSGLPVDPPPWTRASHVSEWIRPLPRPASDPTVDWSAAGPYGPGATPSGVRSGPRPAETGTPLDRHALAGLLSLGAGVSSVEFGPQSAWRHHRIAPSARCVFPCSVRIIGWGREDEKPDIARYHPEHHHMRSRVPFRHARWTRIECVVTAETGATGAHYGDYAYRLVCQETGLLLGGLLLAARALGLRVQADRIRTPHELDRLLGLDGQHECAMAAIRVSGPRTAVVFPTADVRAAGVHRSCPPLADLGPLSAAAHEAFAGTRPVARSVTGIRPAPRPADGATVQPDGFQDHLPVGVPWRRLRAARDSGDPGFIPSPQPLGRGTLDRLRSAAFGTAFPDFWHGGPAPSLVTAALNVTGDERGLFWYDAPGLAGPRSVRRLLAGPETVRFLRRCQMVASTNGHLAPATVFVAVDLAEWLRHHGARAYVELHLRTGEAAQRLLMAASAEGLVARVHNGFLTGPLRELCGTGPWIAPFAVLLSRRRPSARYRFALDGGL
ncbi:nitroreductase family protein [Streptomyces albicerus]|uniref:nitroreductase family protein n=1 Tax=Streptomyces albicerus TaxID=2569859 RepID=UPI00124AF220|nr:nitroreductase family protein [Streptomyces albicerus]